MLCGLFIFWCSTCESPSTPDRCVNSSLCELDNPGYPIFIKYTFDKYPSVGLPFIAFSKRVMGDCYKALVLMALKLDTSICTCTS